MAIRRRTPKDQQARQATEEELAGPKKLEKILKKVEETRKKLRSTQPVDYEAEYNSLSSYHGELDQITAGAGKHLLFTTAQVAYKAGKKDEARELFKQLDSGKYGLTDKEKGMVLTGVFKTAEETGEHEDQLSAGRALLKDADKTGLGQDDRKQVLKGVLSAADKTKDYDLKVETYSELHQNSADYDLTARDKNIVHERLADAYHKRGDNKTALREYGKLYSNVDITQDKEEGEDRFFEYRHGVEDKRGDKEFEAEFTQRRSEIKRKIGSCHMGLKNWGEAEKTYEESLKINNNNLEARNGLGAAQFNLGKQARDVDDRRKYYRKAYKNFEEVTKKTGEGSRLHRSAVNNRGVINYWMGHKVEAEDDLITASKSDPNHKVFGLNRASYLYHERRLKESRDELDKVDAIPPEQETSKTYDSRVEKVREKTTKELRGKTTEKAGQKAEAEGKKLADDVWRKITSPPDLREKRDLKNPEEVAEGFVREKQGIRHHALTEINRKIRQDTTLVEGDVERIEGFLVNAYEGVKRSEKLGIQVEQDAIVESYRQLNDIQNLGEAEKQVKDTAAELKTKRVEEQKKRAEEKKAAEQKKKPEKETQGTPSQRGGEIVNSLCPTEGKEPTLTPEAAADEFKKVYDTNQEQGRRMVSGMSERVG
ncbi:MAG: hypothetical protein GF334_11755, partial [Candidatus Altiarchaeales archaeon]|nr:hypothetical protein [Candidatus Altiarchaeales archaeon]